MHTYTLAHTILIKTEADNMTGQFWQILLTNEKLSCAAASWVETRAVKVLIFLVLIFLMH